MASPHALAGILATKPAQRLAEDVELLVGFLSEQLFFAGVSTTSLELISACLGIHQAAPGQVVLHAGELTDRMYLLLSGSCSVVRHSRREGFQPPPPQQLAPGQALCAASLVVSGRRSDVAVTAGQAVAAPPAENNPSPPPPPPPPPPPQQQQQQQHQDPLATGGANDCCDGGTGSGDSNGSGGGGGEGTGSAAATGGAALVVLTRAAWSNMCARAPLKPEYAEARLALLCCCVRALAALDPSDRTLEQCEDLAALLRLVPGLSHTSAPVLRSMSEAAYLRQLPPGTIIFEECTRAESEFVVLGGTVQTHTRPRRQGAANRAALRSALRSAVAAARGRSARGGPAGPDGGGGAAQPPKTIRQKIEEERRARAQIKQSLALQREGLRTPKAAAGRPTGARAVEEEFKRWMLEFLSRKRTGDANATANAAAGVNPLGAGGNKATAAPTTSARPVSAKTANAWRRAAAKALHVGAAAAEEEGAGGDGGGGAAWAALERADTTLMDYERRKLEEAGGMKDVGNLLGGAAARKAYMRGLAGKGDGGMYAEEEEEEQAGEGAEGASGAANPSRPGVRWGPQEAAAGGGREEPDVEEVEDAEDADPWVRLTYLDRRYQVVRKPIRYIDAVEKVMGVSKQESADAGRIPSSGGGSGGGSGAERDPDADGDGEDARAADDIELLMLNGADDVAGGGGGGAAAAAAGGGGGPGPDDVVDDACDEHFEQLYGPCGGRVELGQVAGELPAAVLDRTRRAGPQRTRRAHSAISGPGGADVLVVALDALRRGHEAARDDLVAGRLAVLTALEPLRGLSDEHQAALALACGVANLDANQVVVRQGQPVEALHVLLEGEVRLLDDPDTTPAAAPPPPPLLQAAPPAGGGGGSGGGGGGGAAPAAGGPESPFRSSGAAPAGLGKMNSLRIRRAAASLAALTLLGPGGSFGENVLGYPEDVSVATTRGKWEEDGAEWEVPPSRHLVTAMTSRPTKLLVLPRSLLVKYGYLRSSLPPFAEQRREAINGRRQQLKVSLQNRPAAAAAANGAAAAAATHVANGNGSGSAASAHPSAGPGTGGTAAPTGGAANARDGGIRSTVQLPSLPSPTASTVPTAVAFVSAGAYQVPRPPPVRPSEVLEQLGIKPVLRRIYNVGTKPGAAAAAAPPNGTSSAAGSAAGGSVTGGNGSGAAGGGGGPGPLPHPAISVNSLAAAVSGGGGGGPDRHHRRELLAASALGANGPYNLSNVLVRAKGGDPTAVTQQSAASLPIVVHSTASSAPLPCRASTDGSLALPTPFSGGGGAAAAVAAAARRRPPRLSASGIGSFTSDNNSPSPVRRSSMSGLVVTNGVVGGSSGGLVPGSIFSVPPLASPPPPLRGAGGAGGSFARAGTTSGSNSGPSAYVASVQLPRLSAPGSGGGGGGGGSAASSPAAANAAGGGRALARPILSGEPFLVRLEAADLSPRSYSPQHNSRSASYGSIAGGGGGSGGGGWSGGGGGGGGGAVVTPPPLGVSHLGQRSASHQSMAKA